MSYCDEGQARGFTPEEAARETEEYIMDNLLDIICEKINEVCNREGITMPEYLKANLSKHYLPVPCSDWYTDEYGNEVQDYHDEYVPGWHTTNEDEVAYIGWMCGLNLTTTQDWDDGSPIFTLTLPTTYDEFLTNIEEGTKFWKEEICGN